MSGLRKTAAGTADERGGGASIVRLRGVLPRARLLRSRASMRPVLPDAPLKSFLPSPFGRGDEFAKVQLKDEGYEMRKEGAT